MSDTLSAAEARRVALAAQGFSRRRPAARIAPRHLHGTMGRLGVLQIDSVNVFSRSHYMPFFSRLGAYDPALLDRVFVNRTTHYVEYLAHEATFIPVEDWPLWRFRMDDFRARRDANPSSWPDPRTLDWVRAELAERGALRSAQLRDDAPRERGSWWDWDEAKQALEYLWRVGEVSISGRRGFERLYALAEHVIPASVRDRVVPRDAAIRELVERAARSSGIATAADLADYYRIRDRAAVARAVHELADEGRLRAVAVRGWEQGGRAVTAWMHSDAVLPRRIQAAALLTPFDPVVWFRQRALRVFELDYRIEIYVPAHRRRYGYYSLPVLVRDRIVARVDLRADRASSTLQVQSAWWEPQGRRGDEAAIAAEIMRAAEWQGLQNISISGWGDAAEAIARPLTSSECGALRHVHPREVSG
ncbi:crosslink repair DNA glycosylase YcaQ family protein [uncultured Microbacterium sp.]|uniref:winged helix-turn-helix domain-containing protein n=1 Tax=uncultured Microbacterium sp. TaxID=191216 RepID=UPI00260A7258|nr:crosslink repair DNA glycosylase YcaQ family protein [uncultured Microbacterium sp.]